MYLTIDVMDLCMLCNANIFLFLTEKKKREEHYVMLLKGSGCKCTYGAYVDVLTLTMCLCYLILYWTLHRAFLYMNTYFLSSCISKLYSTSDAQPYYNNSTTHRQSRYRIVVVILSAWQSTTAWDEGRIVNKKQSPVARTTRCIDADNRNQQTVRFV